MATTEIVLDKRDVYVRILIDHGLKGEDRLVTLMEAVREQTGLRVSLGPDKTMHEVQVFVGSQSAFNVRDTVARIAAEVIG